jgi:pimeloyl-[acyl-carrier protein] synthase
MTATVKQPGIPASFEPVDWNPPGLPTDPDEIVAQIVDPTTRGELYPLFHQLRRTAPMFKSGPAAQQHGAWVFSRFAEVDALSRSPRVVNDPRVLDSAFNHGDGGFTGVMRNVLTWQPVAPHARLRNLIMTAFTPRAIDRWRPIADRVAHELCDRIAADGHAELVEQYNYELPFTIIARILGIPESDYPLIKTYAWDFARLGEARGVDPEAVQRGDDAARGLIAYFGDLAEARRADMGDDLLSSLLAAEADGETLTHTELIANCIYLLQAGHETTQDMLGNAMVALFRHPDQLRLLIDRPELMPEAVKEFLRYDTSVQISHRIALDPLRLDGAQVPEGALLVSFAGAANRDPARFADPDRLDVTRKISSHIAFSAGAYYCIGAALARTEMAAGLSALLNRFPNIRPDGDGFEWRATLNLRGPQTLPVAW